jgi:hypothetical protein
MAVLLVPVVAMACSRPPLAALPPRPPVVTIGMTEHAFQPDRPIPGGLVVFEAENRGTVEHEVVVVEVPPDLPPILEQLRGEERRIITTVVAVPPQAPGASGRFVMDLGPGRYAMICFIQDPDGQSHGAKGMAREFRIS